MDYMKTLETLRKRMEEQGPVQPIRPTTRTIERRDQEPTPPPSDPISISKEWLQRIKESRNQFQVSRERHEHEVRLFSSLAKEEPKPKIIERREKPKRKEVAQEEQKRRSLFDKDESLGLGTINGEPNVIDLPFNRKLGGSKAKWGDAAREAAQAAGIPTNLFLRLVNQESGFNPNAVSSAGARGLAQLMPGTARQLGVDPSDPYENLRGGAKYLRQQFEKFGSWRLALAAYNAGPGAVSKYGGVPPYKETRDYVRRILRG